MKVNKMQALRFQLKGETAFFKKPDVNVHVYFTYNHIHKVALLGILGAVLGLGGYMQQYEKSMDSSKEKQKYPEFYQVLQKARVSIIPHGERGYFSKKIQIFNNTIGYASREAGNILNVREQWLERPEWTIYVASEGLNEKVFKSLSDKLLNYQSTYIPYLGKNDHPASLLNPLLVEIDSIKDVNCIEYIDSLFCAESISCLSIQDGYIKDNQRGAYTKELLPVGLNEVNNGYMYKPYVYTNHEIDTNSINEFEAKNLFTYGKSVLYFI